MKIKTHGGMWGIWL